MIWRLIKLIAIIVSTLIYGSVLYLQLSNVNWSVKCVSGDYNYGCNVPNLNVILLTTIGYALCMIFIVRPD